MIRSGVPGWTPRANQVGRAGRYKRGSVLETDRLQRAPAGGYTCVLGVRPYWYGVYCHAIAGGTYKVPIPDSIHDDLNYGPKMKALCLMLTAHGNMPSRKAGQFIGRPASDFQRLRGQAHGRVRR